VRSPWMMERKRKSRRRMRAKHRNERTKVEQQQGEIKQTIYIKLRSKRICRSQRNVNRVAQMSELKASSDASPRIANKPRPVPPNLFSAPELDPLELDPVSEDPAAAFAVVGESFVEPSD